jgi:hypothetical protein
VIQADSWVELWLNHWNKRNLEGLLELYANDVQVRSPLAKLYASGGVIKGKAALRTYWAETMRRMPNSSLEKVAVYTGHLSLALHCRDNIGRNWIQTIFFDDADKVIYQAACLDRLR